jgi:proline iminopeptidase
MGLILVDVAVEDTSKYGDREKRMQRRKGEAWYEAAMEQWHRQPNTQEQFDAYMKAILPFFFSSYENLVKRQEVFDQTRMSFHALQGQMHSESLPGDLVPGLAGIHIPTLIIVGMDDFVCGPPAALFLHRELPNSKLCVIENAGHFPWLEQPEQFFGGIRDFLISKVK